METCNRVDQTGNLVGFNFTEGGENKVCIYLVNAAGIRRINVVIAVWKDVGARDLPQCSVTAYDIKEAL